jgi:tripartite ATP-independent transporter DctM subunit
MELLFFFIVFVLLMFLNCPVAFAMLLCSFAFFLIKDIPLLVIPERISAGLFSFPLLAMPFFILAARIMNSAGITRRLFNFCLVLVGHKRGGLAHVNVLASLIFSGISGSAMADVAGLGLVEVKAMKENGYDPGYTAAVTAASCTIGPVVPPSMLMIIIGVMMEESVGRLFAGGFIPGIMMALSLIVLIYFQSFSKRIAFPPEMPRASAAEVRRALRESFLALLAPLIILGSILSGVATPTEAGIVAVMYSVVLGIIYKELTLKGLFEVLKDSAFQTGAIMFIVAAAQIFAWIVTTERVAAVVYDLVIHFVNQKWAVLLLVNIVLLVIGCLIEGIAAIMITVPVLLPVMQKFGVDPTHFGVFLCINILIGLLTPPLGMAVYIASDLAQVPVMEGFRKSGPFLIPLVVTLLLVTYIPELTLFIPNLLFK